MFAFAGLCKADSCAILTTAANAVVAQLHDRMPVILDPSDYQPWLDGNEPQHPPVPIEAYPVSTLVNSPKNDQPRCIERIAVDGALL